MFEGKEVCRSIEITDKVKLSSLSIPDQIRLILSSLSNRDEAELDVAEKLTAGKLRKMASLRDLLDKAIDQMEARGKNSVTIKVSSTYLAYIDKMVDSKTGYGQFYNIDVMKRDVPFSIKHYFYVKISKKGGIYDEKD